MLNKSGVTKTTGAAPAQILANVDLQSSVGCIVPKSIGVAVGDKTIVKAGTPVNINLSNLQTAAKLAIATGADMNAVVLHDVDVTAGNANATALIFGFVNLNRIDATTQGKIATALTAAGASKLLTFMKV